MGVDIYWVFQAQTKDGEWIDTPSKYSGDRDSNLYCWLRQDITERRGFPVDFLVNNEGSCHPVTNLEILEQYELKLRSNALGHYRFMGEWGYSWLLGSEIINARAPVEQLTIGVPVEDYFKWDKVSKPELWHEMHSNWRQMEDAEDYTTPENITSDTHWVIAGWERDFSEDFRYFTDEVRRLMALHGEVRFVFGFA